MDEGWRLLETAGRETFQPHVGSTFRVMRDGDAVAGIELARIDDAGSDGRVVGYALLFNGPLDRPLSQGMFLLAHDVLGELVLFLVPVARADRAFGYEAVITRLAVPAAG